MPREYSLSHLIRTRACYVLEIGYLESAQCKVSEIRSAYQLLAVTTDMPLTTNPNFSGWPFGKTNVAFSPVFSLWSN